MEKEKSQNILNELDSGTLLNQLNFTLAKLAIDKEYPKLNEVAQEGVEIITIVRERMVRSLGRLAIKSPEQMLFEYLEKGGNDPQYIEYLEGSSDPRD